MRFDADINARHLGGDLWRAAAPDELDAEGWDDVARAGIHRVVDLRNGGEIGEAHSRPTDLQVVLAPLEDPDDPEYTALWAGNWAIADFYAWGLIHWPDLWRPAFEAIADAPSGGVLIHCAGGRDRTGMLSAILLELAGVDRVAVLADYRRGMLGTNEMLARRGEPDHEAAIPAGRVDEIVQRFTVALDQLLEGLPALLEQSDLTAVATRAAARLT